MHLGIRKIEYIDSTSLHDYSMLPPGSRLDISDFIKSGFGFSELPFTPETANLEEQWIDDNNGKHSQVSFSASIRKGKDSHKSLLQSLVGRKCVWKLTLISGLVYIIGSREYVPKFTYSDGVSGLSSSEFNINIDNESLHGLLVNSAS